MSNSDKEFEEWKLDNFIDHDNYRYYYTLEAKVKELEERLKGNRRAREDLEAKVKEFEESVKREINNQYVIKRDVERWKLRNGEKQNKIETLEAQLEVLTKCEWKGYEDRKDLLYCKCKGCKNKKLLEGVKGE